MIIDLFKQEELSAHINSRLSNGYEIFIADRSIPYSVSIVETDKIAFSIMLQNIREMKHEVVNIRLPLQELLQQTFLDSTDEVINYLLKMLLSFDNYLHLKCARARMAAYELVENVEENFSQYGCKC
jgi:hypothetical protein